MVCGGATTVSAGGGEGAGGNATCVLVAGASVVVLTGADVDEAEVVTEAATSALDSLPQPTNTTDIATIAATVRHFFTMDEADPTLARTQCTAHPTGDPMQALWRWGSGVAQTPIDLAREPSRRESRPDRHHLGLEPDGEMDLVNQALRGSGRLEDRLSDILGRKLDAQRVRGARRHSLGHSRLHEQRPHRLYRDVEFGPFEIESFGDAANSELRRAVGNQLWLTVDCRRRTEVDHLGSARDLQVRERRMAAVDDAIEVDIDQSPVHRERNFLEPSGNQDARIVDENVESATRLDVEFTQPLLPLLRVGDVEDSGDDSPTGRGDRLAQRGQTGLVDIVGTYEVTRARECKGSGSSDPAGSAGDEHSW